MTKKDRVERLLWIACVTKQLSSEDWVALGYDNKYSRPPYAFDVRAAAIEKLAIFIAGGEDE